MRRTPLYDREKELGATFTEFHGWELPLYYSTIREEHLAVRSSVGIFDVSHMGNFLISGPGSSYTMNYIFTNNFVKMRRHQLKYTHMLDEQGRIIDDMIGGMLEENEYMVVPNAAMIEEDLEHMLQHHRSNTLIENLSGEYSIIAVQGPRAQELMSRLTPFNLPSLRFFHCDYVLFPELERHVLLWRSGYTGEDGFEIIVENSLAGEVWDILFKKAGDDIPVKPCGLGARDTLRLEKGFLLSGQDFNRDRTPLETNCEWVVKWDHDFVGKEALLELKERGVKEKLALLLLLDKGVPRPGYKVYKGEEAVGRVSSGTFIPGKETGMALAYVKRELSDFGELLEVDIRGRRAQAKVVDPKKM
ncbi:MAG: glycine cleavage system aminomethyltransferase GcvT [Thermoplasmata archaeon]|nr:glycine cleavage system aminomethyltransferase GcvT [Thermoplasmata archaeon]